MAIDPVLSNAEQVLRSSIAPQAQAIDQDPEALRAALQQLGAHHLLALRVPRSWGGADVSESTFRQFQELIAAYSGALAFLQAQHQSAGSFLARSDNETLKHTYLSKMGTGEALIGISFAHLRRLQPPVKALAVDGGYVFTGQAPWVTGFGMFQFFIAAAVLPSGEAVYGLVPFASLSQSAGGALVCSQPMALAAMMSTNTVTVDFCEWFVPAAQIVSIQPADAIDQSDRCNVLHHSFFALGCARAGVAIVSMAAATKGNAFIQTAHQALEAELAECRAAISAAPTDAAHFAANVRLRAWAIDLAVRCAHAAVTVSSGSANSQMHPAQRIYREALTFTVSGQTSAVMAATLARLHREA